MKKTLKKLFRYSEIQNERAIKNATYIWQQSEQKKTELISTLIQEVRELKEQAAKHEAERKTNAPQWLKEYREQEAIKHQTAREFFTGENKTHYPSGGFTVAKEGNEQKADEAAMNRPAEEESEKKK